MYEERAEGPSLLNDSESADRARAALELDDMSTRCQSGWIDLHCVGGGCSAVW
jgi:hypothetical protein